MPLITMVNLFADRMSVIRRLACTLVLGLGLGTAVAQEVGEVTFVQGVTSAQRPGGESRFLARGDAINQGEVIHTGERGYAVLGLKDGTKLTLRSSTSFAVSDLKRDPGSENLVMNLLRGGLRVVTGLISKARPSAARLNTPTSTIGIRGTEFDARLCGPECRREAQYDRPVRVPPDLEPAVARIALLSGDAWAIAKDGVMRPLARGAAVFAGESVRTGGDSHTVLAFRDRSKITLIEKTEFKLEDVRVAGTPDQGNFVVRLVAGGLRAFTGLIGKVNRSKVKFITPTSTIGIRGTGIDIRLVDGDTVLYTWDGSAELAANGQELVVDTERAGIFRTLNGQLVLLEAVPRAFIDETAVRPDRVEVDFEDLFLVRRIDEAAPGLYVGVRKGNVNLASLVGFIVDLGPYEAGFLADGSDHPVRIEPLPGFLFNDPYPLPDEADLRPLRLIELVGPGRQSASNQCVIQ